MSEATLQEPRPAGETAASRPDRRIDAAYPPVEKGKDVPDPDLSSGEAAAAIALAYFERAAHSPRIGPDDAYLIPALSAAAARWGAGLGAWSGSPRLERYEAPPAGRPVVAVSDSGPQSNSVVAMEIRRLNPADYRGRPVKIFPRMVEVRLHRFAPSRLGPSQARSRLEMTIPYGLLAGGPLRADGVSDTLGIRLAVSMVLAIHADEARRWERARSGPFGLYVASSMGRPKAEGVPLLGGTTGRQVADSVAAAFSPAG